MSDTDEQRCPNCDAVLQGPFCHQCGQRDMDLKRGVLTIVREGVSEVFEIDGKIPRSLVALLLRPGDLTQRWLAGERARFSSPVRLYLFAVVVALFATSFIADRRIDHMAQDGWIRFEKDNGSEQTGFAIGEPGATPIFHASLGAQKDDSAIATGMQDFIHHRPPIIATRNLLRTALDQVPPALITMMVLTTLFLQLAWWRRYLSEHALFSLNLHTVGLYALVVSLIAPVVGDFLGLALIGWHLVAGLRRVYGSGWPRTLFTAVVFAVVWTTTFFALCVSLFLWQVSTHGQSLLDARRIELSSTPAAPTTEQPVVAPAAEE